MNLYAYCSGDPVNRMDTWGLWYEGTGDLHWEGAHDPDFDDHDGPSYEVEVKMVKDSIDPKKASGTLRVVDSSTGLPVSDTWSVVSGPWNKGVLTAGTYSKRYAPRKRNEKSYVDNLGTGWSAGIKQNFDPTRELLAIHPDGNLIGTEGCIGVINNLTEQEKILSGVKDGKSFGQIDRELVGTMDTGPLLSTFEQVWDDVITIEVAIDDNHSSSKDGDDER